MTRAMTFLESVFVPVLTRRRAGASISDIEGVGQQVLGPFFFPPEFLPRVCTE